MDRVVAVVGDSAVLLSQLLQQENERRAQGLPVPREGTPQRNDFLQEILDELVSNQLLLQAAIQDTLLEVDDTRVEESLQERITQIESSFGGRAEMERTLRQEGLSLQSYREMIRDQIGQQQLIGLYIARHGGDRAVEVTEEEMRAFFQAEQGFLQDRPATITFKQVVLTVAPSDSAVAEARARIEGLLARARAGEDFGELATEHSDDPGSAQAGGDLGWFRRGSFAEAFEEAAFRLLAGEVSEVVETPFGFHIIRVERVRFAERQARHILIRPRIEAADIDRTRQLAEALGVRAQGEDFQALIDEHHNPFVFPFRADSATVPQAQMGEMLPPAYVTALANRSAGEVVGPVRFAFRGEEHFALVKILELRDAGAYIFEDLEPQIRTSLMRQKRIEALVADLRSKTYVKLQVN